MRRVFLLVAFGEGEILAGPRNLGFEIADLGFVDAPAKRNRQVDFQSAIRNPKSQIE